MQISAVRFDRAPLAHYNCRLIFGVQSIMYAVIATGGKQYRVSEGTIVRVEKLDADAGA